MLMDIDFLVPMVTGIFYSASYHFKDHIGTKVADGLLRLVQMHT